MYLNLLILIACIGSAWAACPSVEDAAPCTCDEEKLRFDCGYETSQGGEWDIKGYFDRISTLVPTDVVFDELKISYTDLVIIPAGAIQTIKFNKIQITINHLLEYIHPDAFGETTNVTTYLYIVLNSRLTNEGEGHTERDVFDVISKFTAADTIIIQQNGIRVIPDEGFGPLPNLKTFRLFNSVLTRIGSRAFSQLPNLESVELPHCDISIEEIADDAFEGVGPDAVFDMEHNSLTRLPEIPFKPLLDIGKEIVVGGTDCNLIGWCSDIKLDCDEESAWLCSDVEKYQPKVKGFLCKGLFNRNIWDYCASRLRGQQ